MSEFLDYFNLGLVVNAVVFVVTLVFSQRIKDFFAGVPAHTRASLKQIEAGVVAKVVAFEGDLVSKIIPPPAPVAKPPVV